LLVLWVVFAPNRGVFDMIRSRSEIKRLQAENKRLEDENTALQEEINRLQNDPAYLEEKARKEYGMLKENEVLYIFKKKEK
jgi:cell division protein FtsB